MDNLERCGWAKSDLDIEYHDKEWGTPIYDDDRKLFEFIILESAQAGLSWATILKKRENFRKAFDNFDPIKISKYNNKKKCALLENAGIIRNKAKIQAAIENAKVFLQIQQEFETFSNYIWKFTDGKIIHNNFKEFAEVPAQTELSQRISKDLKLRGLKFFGPVTCYAYLQAVGIVNDHLVKCYRHKGK